MGKTSMKIEKLNEEISNLSFQKTQKEYELSYLLKSLEGKKAKKVDLQKELDLRREINKLDSEISSKEEEKKALESDAKAAKHVTALGLIALSAIIGVTVFAATKGKCATKDANDTKSIVTASEPEDNKELAEVTSTPVITVEPTSTPEPTPEPILVDASNDEDVLKAVDYIYAEDINSILEGENNEVFTKSFTNEDVEDIIRVVNGELPVNSEYDEYTIGETANLMNDILANKGSVGNKLYPVHFSYLYPTSSKEAEYVETYDEVYNKIAEYRAENNVDGFVEMVGVLGSKLYNEWHLAGLYGGYNPYLFRDEEHYFLLQAATSRFSNYVREYLEANDLTVCIPTCYNIETEEYKLVEVRDIFEAMYMGTSKNGEISVLRSGEVINIFAETYKDAKDYLDNKANVKVKGLN